jgi:hypothetical protein
MKKCIILLAYLTVAIGATRASAPMARDGRVYAMSLAGIYPHENLLLQKAVDDSAEEPDRFFATQEAIFNEWNGPFRLRDFALWLKENHLEKRLALAGTNWDIDGSFKHLPDNMRKLSFDLRGTKPESIAVFAIDKTLTFQEVQSVLQNPSNTAVGDGPIVYGIKPTQIFPGTIIVQEKD